VLCYSTQLLLYSTPLRVVSLIYSDYLYKYAALIHFNLLYYYALPLTALLYATLLLVIFYMSSTTPLFFNCCDAASRRAVHRKKVRRKGRPETARTVQQRNVRYTSAAAAVPSFMAAAGYGGSEPFVVVVL